MKRSVSEVVDADTDEVNNADSLQDHYVQDHIEDSDDISESAQRFHEDILEEHTDVSNKINKSSCSFELEIEEDPIIPPHVILSCIRCEIKKSESSEICHILAKYCSDKLKNVLASAIKYKSRWNRKKLTAGDFNKGLFFCGEKPVYEFPDIHLPKKSRLRKKTKLDISGIKSDDFNVSNTKLEATISVSKAWLDNEEILSSDILSSDIPEELKLYFNRVTKYLVNLEEESLNLALEDLKFNKNISCLVPFFIDFLVSKIDELSHSDLPKLLVVLRATDSLVTNTCLCFREDSYLKKLSHTLIKCLIDSLQHYLGDFWLLKDTIAELLASVLRRSKSEALTFEIIFFLEAAFCDRELPFISHYGAVAAVNAIGVSAINLVIIPHIDSYLAYLNSVEIDSSMCFRERSYACAVQGQIRHSYYLLTQHFLKHEFEGHHFYSGGFLSVSESLLETGIPASLKDSFTEYFGDTLVQCFPLWNFASCNMNKKLKKQVLIKSSTRKLKDFKSVNRKLPEKMTVDNGDTIHKLRASVFDYHPVKKCVIKFGKIRKNNRL